MSGFLYYVHGDERAIYRAQPHEIWIRHTLYIEKIKEELDEKRERGELTDGLYLQVFTAYPLLVAGLRSLEKTTFEGDDTPEDIENMTYETIHENRSQMNYHPLDFEAFLDLPENFVVRCMEAIYAKNPLRAMEYEWLKKTQEALQNQMQSGLNNLIPDLPGSETQSVSKLSSTSKKKTQAMKA